MTSNKFDSTRLVSPRHFALDSFAKGSPNSHRELAEAGTVGELTFGESAHNDSMKNIASKVLACLAVFVSLAVVGAPQTGKGYHVSGVVGQVHGDILFHDWNVLVLSDEGEVVADFLSDPNGDFEVDLKPGTYTLVAYIPNFFSRTVFGIPATVTVAKKQFASVVLSISLPPS